MGSAPVCLGVEVSAGHERIVTNGRQACRREALTLFMPEGGWDNGDPHSGENMVTLIAGRAGGLKPGKHLKATGKHPVQVLISAMNAAGVATDTLGEISGQLPELFS
jgi:hypothetical protein